LKTLLKCDIAVLKITNQKNERRRQTITQLDTGDIICSVKALAHIIHHIISNGDSDETLLCSYHKDSTWHTISKHIVAQVRKISSDLNLDKQGIDPDLIGAHSLRAGGTMALKLHGESDTTNMKMGRWISLTFLQYIHYQIAHLSKDISKKMSIELPFVNIAVI